MTQTKECFGQCANLSIRYRDHSRQHYLRVDEEKLKECDTCSLFARCAFLKHNEMIRELLMLIDQAGIRESRPRLG